MKDFIDGLYFIIFMLFIIVPPLFIKNKGE